MGLAEIPMLFVLAGLVLYVVLGGADYGAALWQATTPRTPEGERLRTLAHDAMAPVWEANHVWLIFVLTVTWTAYPVALASLASTLAIPLSIAAFGLIARGAAYALSTGTSDPREIRRIDAVSAVSSVLAPFGLGACVGALASGRVPRGNAAGDLWSSWLTPTSILLGALAVAFSAYLAAVYLCADAVGRGQGDLAPAFRRRALGAAAVAGALAVAGLVVLHEDAHPLYRGLVAGDGLPALLVSLVAGAATAGLVATRRYAPARLTAALAVTATIAGWALAQQPRILPGLTVDQAAASHDTLVAVLVALVGGGIILAPSLVLLLRLSVGGRLGHGGADDHGPAGDVPAPAGGKPLLPVAPQLAARAAGACFVVALGMLTVAEAGWAHAVGVAALVGAVVGGFVAAVPPLVRDEASRSPGAG